MIYNDRPLYVEPEIGYISIARNEIYTMPQHTNMTPSDKLIDDGVERCGATQQATIH